MRVSTGLLVVLLTAGVSGCGTSGVLGETPDCMSEKGHAALIDALKGKIESGAADVGGKDDSGIPRLPKSKIRALLKDVKFALLDIRTTKEDPNSTKRFCTANLKVTFSEEAVEDATKAAEAVGGNSWTDEADKLDFERGANWVKMPIDFNVQPTDDGEKIYAEIEDGNSIFKFLSDLAAASLLRRAIENAKHEQDRQEAEAKAQADKALADQRAASIAEARAAMDLSVQAINAAWQALDPDVRAELLPLQRAWVKRKSADCKVESASVSLDSSDREVSRMQCEVRMNNDRRNELQRLSYNY
ncbi:MAG TPA: lysozyme inhibitor LprI family protein [Novosphingobium sp.]